MEEVVLKKCIRSVVGMEHMITRHSNLVLQLLLICRSSGILLLKVLGPNLPPPPQLMGGYMDQW